MALFGRDYDREYGYGAGPRGNRMYGTGWGGYDRNYRAGYGGATEYDEGYGYKSRWQTDFGDPYGDRSNRTPMRVIRGEFRGDYGGDYRGFSRPDYDRSGRYGANPMSYDPYENRGGYQGRGTGWNRGGRWNAGANRDYPGYGENRYDRGWF